MSLRVQHLNTRKRLQHADCTHYQHVENCRRNCRQRNMGKDLQFVCAVDTCRLFQRAVDVGKRGGKQQYAVAAGGPQTHYHNGPDEVVRTEPVDTDAENFVYKSVLTVEQPVPHKRRCRDGTHIRHKQQHLEELCSAHLFGKQFGNKHRQNNGYGQFQHQYQVVKQRTPEVLVRKHGDVVVENSVYRQEGRTRDAAAFRFHK